MPEKVMGDGGTGSKGEWLMRGRISHKNEEATIAAPLNVLQRNQISVVGYS